jgi:hypothetical protein
MKVTFCVRGVLSPLLSNLVLDGLSHVPISELRASRGVLTVAQKSADGIVGHDVGKASEALQRRKVEQRIGRAGNERE